MTRAYIRLDPAFDERKESYPDGPYAALVATFCLAEHQPERGRFRSLDYLSRLLGKRGRHARYLLDHGDLTTLDDGRVYVDGWDEWQEGDWKVAERVSRIRNRERRQRRVTVPTVTPVTLHPTKAPETVRQSAGGSRAMSEAMSAGSPPAEDDDPERPALLALASWGATVPPNGNGIHRKLIDLVRRRGIGPTLAALEEQHRRDGSASGRQLVFSAEDALDRPIAKAAGSSGGHTRSASEVDDAFNR